MTFKEELSVFFIATLTLAVTVLSIFYNGELTTEDGLHDKIESLEMQLRHAKAERSDRRLERVLNATIAIHHFAPTNLQEVQDHYLDCSGCHHT